MFTKLYKSISFCARTGNLRAAVTLEEHAVHSSTSTGRAALLQENDSQLVHTHQAVLIRAVLSFSIGSGEFLSFGSQEACITPLWIQVLDAIRGDKEIA